MQEVIEIIDPCIFCTKLGHVPFASRPMTTLKADDEGGLWFFSAADSHKNADIRLDDHVELLYSDLQNSNFLSVHGRAEIIRDAEVARELWKPVVQEWIQYMPDDPELTLIKVTPILGYWWDGKQNRMVEMLKMSVPEVLGSPVGSGNGVEAALSS